MVDIHTHILPGLDDGAESLADSLELAQIAVETGVGHIVATSHGNYYSYHLEDYEYAFEKVCRALKEEGIPLKLYKGMEVYMDESAIDRIKRGRLLPINNTDYYLVEFSFREHVPFVIGSLMELLDMGKRPILAHPERYEFVKQDPDLGFFLHEQGVVLQSNVGSLLGAFGQNSRKIASLYLRNGIISVLGSDAHDTIYRTTAMDGICEYLLDRYPERVLHRLLSENPERILKGQDLLRQG